MGARNKSSHRPTGLNGKTKDNIRLGEHGPPGSYSYPPSSAGLHGHSPFKPRPKEGGAGTGPARNFSAWVDRGSPGSPSREAALILQRDAGLVRALLSRPARRARSPSPTQAPCPARAMCGGARRRPQGASDSSYTRGAAGRRDTARPGREPKSWAES